MVLNPLVDLQFATHIQFHFNLTDKTRTTIWKKIVDTNILFWNRQKTDMNKQKADIT